MNITADPLILLSYSFRELVLFALLIGAVYGDLRHGRIFNWMTGPAIALGLAIAFGLDGFLSPEGGLVHHLIALAVPVAIFGIPYALGWFGAGDVKLLAAIGAIEGLAFILTTMLFTGIVGGALALGYLGARKWRPVTVPASSDPAEIDHAEPPPSQIPYGVAIVTGATLTWFLTVI